MELFTTWKLASAKTHPSLFCSPGKLVYPHTTHTQVLSQILLGCTDDLSVFGLVVQSLGLGFHIGARRATMVSVSLDDHETFTR